ncbi:MAG: ATP-binding protein [Planctomycetes bacterium]|nr:ATP-binding protein [Planctomycetota bacterium]
MPKPLRDKLLVSNDTRYLVVVREFIARMLRLSGFTREDGNKIVLAVDEAVTNVMEHGYGRVDAGVIEIEVRSEDGQFLVVIRDSGRVFNPVSTPPVDVRAHLRAGRKKGLGVFLMRKIMDRVDYQLKDGVKNELTLVKYAR